MIVQPTDITIFTARIPLFNRPLLPQHVLDIIDAPQSDMLQSNSPATQASSKSVIPDSEPGCTSPAPYVAPPQTPQSPSYELITPITITSSSPIPPPPEVILIPTRPNTPDEDEDDMPEAELEYRLLQSFVSYGHCREAARK